MTNTYRNGYCHPQDAIYTILFSQIASTVIDWYLIYLKIGDRCVHFKDSILNFTFSLVSFACFPPCIKASCKKGEKCFNVNNKSIPMIAMF